MTKKRVPYIILALLLFAAGCKQDTDNTTLNPYYYDYAPINVGHSIVYDVDSILFSYETGGSQVVNDKRYQLMYQVYDTMLDQGIVKQGLLIWKRPDSTQPFTVADRMWYCWQSRNTFEQVEDDLHFIKLVFPPVQGITWQGNEYLPASDTIPDVYQPYSGWSYTITSANVPAVINGIRLDSTVTVLQDSNQNLINDVVSTETYARHIGLVYKKWEVITKQGISSTWANPDSANGFRLIMQLHSYTP